MPFSREFIRKAAKESGVEIPKELEDALVQEHISARDAYAGEQVKVALENNKPAEPIKVKDSEEYKTLKKEYDTYKADQESKETYRAKEAAYRGILKSAGVPEKRIAGILKVSKETIDSLELDENGAAKNADKLAEDAKAEWADFIPTTVEKGAPTPTPPSNTGGGITKEEIYKKDDKGRYVLSASERQKAIAENPELFGI